MNNCINIIGVTFGAIAAFPMGSIICDKYGRRASVTLGQSFTILGSILQGASTNYGFFLAARIVLGLGYTMTYVGSPTLISEIAYPTHRESCTFAFMLCYYVGALLAAWVTYGTRVIVGNASWRIPSYLQAACPAIQIAFMWLIPESPRYLISKGRRDQAETVFKKFHIGNSDSPEDLQFIDAEIREIEATIEAQKTATKAKYSDFITKKSYRKRIFFIIFTAIMMQLSGNGLVSYYLSKVLDSIGITEEKRQLQINGYLMLYNLGICCIVCSLVGYFKRRTLFITCVSGMLVSYIIWTILSALNEERGFKEVSLANGVLAMIFIYYLFYNIGVNGLPYIYVTEILTYSHRAKGVNIFTLTQMIILVYNGYVNPIAMEAILWKYYIVYCCILAVELVVVVLFYPETSGYTLEEVAKVFGEDTPSLGEIYDVQSKSQAEHVEKV